MGFYGANPTDTSAGVLAGGLTCANPSSAAPLAPSTAGAPTCSACTAMTGCQTAGTACSVTAQHTTERTCTAPTAAFYLNASGITDVPILRGTCKDKVGSDAARAPPPAHRYTYVVLRTSYVVRRTSYFVRRTSYFVLGVLSLKQHLLGWGGPCVVRVCMYVYLTAHSVFLPRRMVPRPAPSSSTTSIAELGTSSRPVAMMRRAKSTRAAQAQGLRIGQRAACGRPVAAMR